jgi:hypothetical protein
MAAVDEGIGALLVVVAVGVGGDDGLAVIPSTVAPSETTTTMHVPETQVSPEPQSVLRRHEDVHAASAKVATRPARTRARTAFFIC